MKKKMKEETSNLLKLTGYKYKYLRKKTDNCRQTIQGDHSKTKINNVKSPGLKNNIR